MARELGADFDNDKPYFSSPTNPNDKIYLIWDPPHMLKLARGCLKHHKLYHNGSALDWNFIATLHNMQQNHNINLGNKLTNAHINFEAKPMHVRTACETLSNSVAVCIDQLRSDGYNEFKDSEATTEYIRFCNNVFDILNYKPNVSGAVQKFKRALNPSTASEFFEYFAKAKEFFQSIEIDEVYTRKVENKNGKKEKEKYSVRKLAIKSRNNTPFFGFYHNMTAIQLMYTDLVENGPLEELHTFWFSQDHLETWFSSVRIRLGKCFI